MSEEVKKEVLKEYVIKVGAEVEDDTFLDLCAIAAMNVIITCYKDLSYSDIAFNSYTMAKAMVAERKRRKENTND